ncbi:two-component regulator propeller domain-containing protein [Marinilabiliaceae bacterium ANBcel2]|nr:two-component regulator propeller domain-containing protein [Marinilabiliaceae bacterium ANBcel2]
MSKPLCISFLFFLFFFLNEGEAQTYNFASYDTNSGLPHNFIYALQQDKNGFLWGGTAEGLVKYNGIEFEVFNRNDSLAYDFITSLLTLEEGKLIAGHNNGDITIYEDGEFIPIYIEDSSGPVNDISVDDNGYIWAVVQNSGIVRIDNYNNVTKWFDSGNFSFTLFYALEHLDGNLLLIGSSDGLMEIDLNEDGSINRIERIGDVAGGDVNSIVARNNGEEQFWVGTREYGLFLYSRTNRKVFHFSDNDFCLDFSVDYLSVRDIVEEPNGDLMIATWGDGVIRFFYDSTRDSYTNSFSFSVENGLASDYITDILIDNEGNYWFASYGGGVSSLTCESMTFYNLDNIGFANSSVRSVEAIEDMVWLGLDNGIIEADPFCFSDYNFYGRDAGLPDSDITGLHFCEMDSLLWVATGQDGLYYKNLESDLFNSYYYTSSLNGKQINDIAVDQPYLYLATTGGFFIIDTFENDVLEYNTASGLPHNNINFVTLIKDDVWIGPRNSGICRVGIDSFDIHRVEDGPVDVSGMDLKEEGTFLLATKGQGVIEYSRDSTSFISSREGLARNFCYDIKADAKGRIWVAHFPGLSVIDYQHERIKTYDHSNNMGEDFYQIKPGRDDLLWFAFNGGVISYNPLKDKINSVPPLLNFTSVLVSGEEVCSGLKIELPYSYGDDYRFRFEFTGISLSAPEEVRYESRLIRGGDVSSAEWIDLGTSRYREYDYLPDGTYRFEVRAVNSDGVYTLDSIAVDIVIAPPLWKRVWFIALMIIIMGVIIYFVILFRERKLRRQKEALQREVESQTIILRQQKAEIERKNQDITDSINYAKKIQSSILPPAKIIEKEFKESFIFFAPRDIVSGDFYWFHPFGDSFLFCAADCTGHGVPGAFMSMIGTTLLNDIVKREDVFTPSDILTRLDAEIKILLQKNETDNTRDGMDISIVEFDSKNSIIRAASAKRPVYMFINEEFVVYKGQRRSIGDNIVEEESDFIDFEKDVSTGDLVYLFSDGYSDQFGGPDGKKFMTSRVRKLLKEIYLYPMKDQLQIVHDKFYSWRGDEEQVDDVVFMGVKL